MGKQKEQHDHASMLSRILARYNVSTRDVTFLTRLARMNVGELMKVGGEFCLVVLGGR